MILATRSRDLCVLCCESPSLTGATRATSMTVPNGARRRAIQMWPRALRGVTGRASIAAAKAAATNTRSCSGRLRGRDPVAAAYPAQSAGPHLYGAPSRAAFINGGRQPPVRPVVNTSVHRDAHLQLGPCLHSPQRHRGTE